jgi:hypothetical protein
MDSSIRAKVFFAMVELGKYRRNREPSGHRFETTMRKAPLRSFSRLTGARTDTLLLIPPLIQTPKEGRS